MMRDVETLVTPIVQDYRDDSGRAFHFVTFDNGSHDLVVHFSAFTTPFGLTKEYRNPFSYYFHRLKLLGGCTDHNWLFLCDEYGAEKNGTYYTGERGDFFVERAMKHLIEDAMSQFGIGPERTITVGSSMGGTGALKFGMLYGVRGIVALSPHIDLDTSAATQNREPHVSYIVSDADPYGEHNRPVTRQLRNLLAEWDDARPLPRLFLQTCQDDSGVYAEQVLPFANGWRVRGGQVDLDIRRTGGHNSPHATRPLLLDVIDRQLVGLPIDVRCYQREGRFQHDRPASPADRARRLARRVTRPDGATTSRQLARRAVKRATRSVRAQARRLPTPRFYARLRMTVGRRSMSYLWGMDRGQAIDRFYLEERFLTEFADDIKGHCLEFGKPWYTNRFGAGAVTKADVLTAPHDAEFYNSAEIVADLTKPNDIPSDTYDCIVCTQVINIVPEYPTMLRELHRILRPGGVLLIAVPHVNMNYPKNPGLFRFTPDGLLVTLEPVFGDNITMRSYGNSLTAAAVMRGVVSTELPKRLLDYQDEYYPVEVCARATKGV